MFWPAVTGSGMSILVTERSALSELTVVDCVAVLLAAFGSPALEATVAVLLIGLAAPRFTFTTRVKVCGPAAVVRLGLVAVTVPVPPTAGVAVVHPAGATKETKVVPAGTLSVRLTLAAASGPAFVTVIV